MIRNSATAILNHASLGPVFGSFEGSFYSDIYLNENSDINTGYAAFWASYS